MVCTILCVIFFGILQGLVLGQETEPVRQTVPQDCHNGTRDCPEYFDDSQWKIYQDNCCGPDTELYYHCQEFTNEKGGSPVIVVACVLKLTCEAGTYARIKISYQGTTPYAKVECDQCTDDLFQPSPKDSYKFRFPTCEESRQQCLKKHGLMLAKRGNSSQDNLCRCWWEGGYAPRQGLPECSSLEGFTHGDYCQCEGNTCPDGEQLNKDFQCVAGPNTAKPNDAKTTTPATTTKAPPKLTGGARSEGPAGFLVVLTTFAPAIVIWVFFAPMTRP